VRGAAVDLAAVATARHRLRQIAVENPDMRWPTDDDLVAIVGDDDEMKATIQIAIRVEPELAERIDRQVEAVKKEHPGMSVGRADIIRTATIKYLDITEADEKPRKK
jgi:hypothetical protein